jgi:ribosomal-protein-alanine N-acetyltransferase
MRRIAAIDTARLRLRPYRDSDLDALHALWTDTQVRRYLWDDAIIERTLAAEVMRASIATTAAVGFGHWAVCPAAEEDLIGFCGFRPLAETSDIEILYGLLPSHWGRGLATEAAHAMLRFGFEEAGFARVIAITDVPNTASVAVMRRLNMQFDARFVHNGLDSVRYVMRREAFRPAHGRYIVNEAERTT